MMGLLWAEGAKTITDVQAAAMPENTSYPSATDYGRSTLRYLAGRCVAKAQWNLQRSIKINLYKNWDRV